MSWYILHIPSGEFLKCWYDPYMHRSGKFPIYAFVKPHPEMICGEAAEFTYRMYALHAFSFLERSDSIECYQLMYKKPDGSFYQKGMDIYEPTLSCFERYARPNW